MMNNLPEYPSVVKRDQGIEINILAPGCASTRSVNIRLVLDLDHWGQVIGIEALDLCFHGGGSLLVDFDFQKLISAGIKVGYDGDVDAFYLRIEEGRSDDQRSVDGKLFLSENGHLVGIAANLA